MEIHVRPKPSPPRWRKILRRLSELSLVAVAVTLTVANSSAPSVRSESIVRERQGALRMKLDKRVYTDLPFSVELPKGTYSTLTLYRFPSEDDLTSERKRVLLLSAGDPRLSGDPIRIPLLHPTAEGEPTGPAEYLLVVTDAEGGVSEVRFGIVQRETSNLAVEERSDEDHK